MTIIKPDKENKLADEGVKVLSDDEFEKIAGGVDDNKFSPVNEYGSIPNR